MGLHGLYSCQYSGLFKVTGTANHDRWCFLQVAFATDAQHPGLNGQACVDTKLQAGTQSGEVIPFVLNAEGFWKSHENSLFVSEDNTSAVASIMLNVIREELLFEMFSLCFSFSNFESVLSTHLMLKISGYGWTSSWSCSLQIKWVWKSGEIRFQGNISRLFFFDCLILLALKIAVDARKETRKQKKLKKRGGVRNNSRNKNAKQEEIPNSSHVLPPKPVTTPFAQRSWRLSQADSWGDFLWGNGKPWKRLLGTKCGLVLVFFWSWSCCLHCFAAKYRQWDWTCYCFYFALVLLSLPNLAALCLFSELVRRRLPLTGFCLGPARALSSDFLSQVDFFGVQR